MSDSCPCGKPSSYDACCGRFIRGGEKPRTPEQLMRSRYTAYALGGCGDYLLRTWFPVTAKGLTAVQLSNRSVNFLGLEVLSKSQSGDEGTVEFKAYYRPLNESSDESGAPAVMHEYSEFKRINGNWYYVGGRVE